MPKPWADKDGSPWTKGPGNNDGGRVDGPTPFEKDPGDGGFHPPNPNPTADDTAKRKPGGIA
jgi:hypothetical protein